MTDKFYRNVGTKMKVATSVLELIGNTPLLEMKHFKEKYRLGANIYAKLERSNPGGSAKDRIALEMIEDAEARGVISAGATIIEPTSGNTGVGLAMVCAVRGYKAIIVMPDSMSVERRTLLKAYGAELVFTPGSEGMKGAIAKAEELQRSTPNSFIPGQFDNKANARAHFKTTGPEIYDALDGNVDFLVAGVGTGGTITGTAEFLKSKNKAVKAIAVEPYSSQVLAGKEAGAHKIQGIGANFVPSVLNRDIIDEVMPITDDEAYDIAREIGITEGVVSGISSGAAMAAALKIARRPEANGKNIVVILTDTGERYLSTGVFD